MQAILEDLKSLRGLRDDQSTEVSLLRIEVGLVLESWCAAVIGRQQRRRVAVGCAN